MESAVSFEKLIEQFRAMPGIGAKTAERLILDLKDKVKIDDTMIKREIAATAAENGMAVENAQIHEAVEALVSLGYGRTESLNAVKAVDGAADMDSGQLLKAALKKMF